MSRDEVGIQQEEPINEKLAQRCLEALRKNNIPAYYLPDRSQALNQILSMIPSGATVGAGDSLTLTQIGIIEELEKRGSNQLFNPFRKEGKAHFPATRRELVETARKALAADFFLTGLNAITMDGKIINTDRMGNRITGLIFGPKKVIAVTGINKIVANLEEALERIKKIAAPANAYRHKIEHNMESPPCAITGICIDCRHPGRLCCFTVIVEFQSQPRIEVVLIGENLGI